MPRRASSRSALGTSAKPILASQPDREVRAPLTVMSVYRLADQPGNTVVTCGRARNISLNGCVLRSNDSPPLSVRAPARTPGGTGGRPPGDKPGPAPDT